MAKPTVIDNIIAAAALAERPHDAPADLADTWQDMADLVAIGLPDRMITNRLARFLSMHLAIIELPWATAFMRDACRARAEQIVDQIGWPQRGWLDGAVEAQIQRFQAAHSRRAAEVPA